MKKIFKENSIYIIVLTILEIVLSIFSTIAFVYSDALSYSDSLVYNALGVETLLESMYSSTWWALILLLLAFIAIFSLTSIIYKKMEYFFLSIMCWVEMFILSINLNNDIKTTLITCLLFIPIILINIITYIKQKEKLHVNELKTKKTSKK